MDERIKRRRQEEEVLRTPNWSELNPDLLRCIFERLSFTSLNRAKLVCSSWYSASRGWSELNPGLLRCVFKRLSFISLNRVKLVCSSWYYASRGCVPNQNQIPWLILFPPKALENDRSRCEFFVPEDKEKVYRSRGLGVEFARIYCVTTCGSWLLLLNNVHNLYILNPLTGDRIDLPDTLSFEGRSELRFVKICFWIDNKTKDYLVVMMACGKFTKKGYSNWQNLPKIWSNNVFYNDKNRKLYVYVEGSFDQDGQYVVDRDDEYVDVWDFSGDKPHHDKTISLPLFGRRHFHENNMFTKRSMAFTVSGDFLMVEYAKQESGSIYFRFYKMNRENTKWMQIDSLGDEALIYDLGITVIANDKIPGIKRNYVYSSQNYSMFFGRNVPGNMIVYDITTQQKKPLPQCVLSAMPSLTKARWFFPC